MPYDSDKHHRRSIRLQDYDYTQNGAYFITICTSHHDSLFGMVRDDQMVLNEYGQIVYDEWLRTAQVRDNVELDVFIVMPNHMHGIIWLVSQNDSEETLPSNPPKGVISGSIGAIVGQFKSRTTRQINQLRDVSGVPIWQRNYYEHIIRNDRSLNTIRTYIQYNPLRWQADRYHSDRSG